MEIYLLCIIKLNFGHLVEILNEKVFIKYGIKKTPSSMTSHEVT